MKKVISILFIIFGCMPFGLTLFYGLYLAITGYCTGFFGTCNKMYGWEAFSTGVFFMVLLFWFVYLIALILIIVGIILLATNKKVK